MPRAQNINKVRVRRILEHELIDKRDLNKLFYYSLIDSSSFEEDAAISTMLEDHQKKARTYLRGFLRKHSYDTDRFPPKAFEKFEGEFIGNDTMSKILLKRQLTSIGLQAELPAQTRQRSFDLRLGDGTFIELKRICTWSGYADYFMQFLEKVDEHVKSGQSSRFLLLVAGVHAFVTEWVFKDSTYLDAFNDFITGLVRSHYVVERLLPQMETKRDIVIVIDHIVSKERRKEEDSNTLISLCNEIKQKVEETNPPWR
jgi:hypothetical protein